MPKYNLSKNSLFGFGIPFVSKYRAMSLDSSLAPHNKITLGQIRYGARLDK